MNKMVLILSVICILITSCSKESKFDQKVTSLQSPTNISSDVVRRNSNGINLNNPSTRELYALINEFFIAKEHYPQSIQEYVDYIETSTNGHSVNLETFKSLTFEQKKGGSLTVIWETKEEPTIKGHQTFYPRNYSTEDTGWQLSGHGSVSGQITNAQPIAPLYGEQRPSN